MFFESFKVLDCELENDDPKSTINVDDDDVVLGGHVVIMATIIKKPKIIIMIQSVTSQTFQ